MRRFSLFPALAFALVGAGPGLAQSRAERADLECIMVSFYMASDEDPGTQEAGLIGSFYFLGKLQAANPRRDLEAELTREMARVKPGDFAAIGERCLGELEARGKALEIMGANMEAKER